MCIRDRDKIKEAGGKYQTGLLAEMMALTGDVIGESFFGEGFRLLKIDGEPVTDVVAWTLDKIMWQGIENPLCWMFGPKALDLPLTAEMRKINRWIKLIRGLAYDKVLRREAQLKEDTDKGVDVDQDLLSIMLDVQQRSENKEVLSHNELVDIFIQFSSAGTDTTANLVTNTIFFLTKNPAAYEKALKEINEKRPSNVNGYTIEKLNEFVYLDACLKETFRRFPFVPLPLIRVATADHMLGDLKIKKGCLLYTSPSPRDQA
eukprot:TRINITY_DN27542_c0_g1_i1.p1 TRINITY_DN27542_c0_g1~~TRINITY_DN27542_c0_g1_i1.p1  ORF type:complete len:272 (+),score=70.73 TRINITY_DN27542_c0_g1_i1:34-816(+)